MVWWWLTACGWFDSGPEDPGLDAATIAEYIPDDVEDELGWAADVRAALVAAELPVDESHVCQVLAVIEQESTYRADPAVPGLGRIARGQIEENFSLLGPLSTLGIDWLLSPTPDGQTRSFADRLAKVTTEGELDELYQDIAAYHTRHAAGLPLAGTLLARELDKLNPIETSGSMQVSVAWAQVAGKREGIPRDTVRKLLYTRAGGLRWGVARLFDIDADYDDPLYRFADYNAGVYASRNAAFQAQLAEIMGLSLALDGDLLAYTDAGPVEGETMGALLAWRALHAADLAEGRIRAHARREKERSFETTTTYARLKEHYRERTGEEPVYARLPDVALRSPKLSRSRTTAWFAKNVDRRYEDCLERHEPPANTNTSPSGD
ncbi:MAG: DUF1615 family protein [Myxococcota bacterium]